MERRQFLQTTALGALATAFGSNRQVFAQANEAIHFACLAPMSGPFAANGKFTDLGMKLAIEQYGSVLKRPLGYTVLDTEGKPAAAVRKVQEIAQQKGVKFFVGGILSSEALAISKEIARIGGVYMTSAGADEITGAECNAVTFRWSVPTYGAIEQSVRPLIGMMPKAKRWYTITPQYVFGDDLLKAAKNTFKEMGVEHVGNSYHSLAEKEFSGYITNAISANPDVLLLLNFSSQCADTLRQAISFGLNKKMTILVAWASGLEQFESLGADICDGIYFGAQYWHTVDTKLNKELVKLCMSKLNINPNYSLASQYTSSKIILDGIQKANSTEPKTVIAALEGMKFEGLTGIEEVRKEDHQVIKNYYLLKGKPKSKMKNKDDYVDVLNSGKSFLPIDKTGCKRS